MAKRLEKAEEVDNKQCRTCLYGDNLKYNAYNCLYILFMGHSRGCEPSPNCTKYKKFNQQERDELERNTSSFFS